MPVQILKFSSLIILVVLVIIVGFLVYNFTIVKAQAITAVNYEMAGWLWSGNYGWISLSSNNCDSAAGCLAGAQYNIETENISDNISGYGWSSNVGWVCFGATCSGTPPGGGSSFAQLNIASNQISGWAKIISLGDDGWLKLGRGQETVLAMGEQCYNCQPVCKTWTWQCVGDPPVCDWASPCVEFDTEKYLNCDTCFSETYFCEDLSNCKQPPTSVDPVAGGSGLICSGCGAACSEPTPTCNQPLCEKRYDATGSAFRIVCKTTSCSSCQLFGANRDESSGQLLGWGWNGDNTKKIGAGWAHFNSLGGAAIVYPWLETRYGSIYARLGKEVRQKAGTVGNNVTYCIFAQDIKNIRSANCQEPIRDIDFQFPQPSASQIYRNALGKIDVVGLTTVVKNGRNKYGQEVVSISSFTGAKVLGRKVYVANGDLTINGSLIFNNADEDTKYGNGIIIVNGNLYLNNDIIYSGGIPEKLNQLASVAWIVKGDVIVSPAVTRIAGAFIVLGNNVAPCLYVTGAVCDGTIEYPHYQQNGHGVFFSGSSSVDPLTVSGLLAARAFDFSRTYAQAARGSERITYDGRLVANPPPGLEGFVEKLPVIRDFAY